MATASSETRTITVDAEVHDKIRRTAERLGTDPNGALRYLLDVPDVPAINSSADDSE